MAVTRTLKNFTRGDVVRLAGALGECVQIVKGRHQMVREDLVLVANVLTGEVCSLHWSTLVIEHYPNAKMVLGEPGVLIAKATEKQT